MTIHVESLEPRRLLTTPTTWVSDDASVFGPVIVGAMDDVSRPYAGTIRPSDLASAEPDIPFEPALSQPDELGIIFAGYGSAPETSNWKVITNRNAADTTNADQLWSGGGLGLNLAGDGYRVGVWDGGSVRATHQ